MKIRECKLEKYSAAVIAEAKAKGLTITSICDLEDAGISLYDLHAYAGQYAVNTGSATYRAAFDRIATFIERQLAPAKTVKLILEVTVPTGVSNGQIEAALKTVGITLDTWDVA